MSFIFIPDIHSNMKTSLISREKKMNELSQLFPPIFILLRRHFIGIMTPCQLFSNNRTYLYLFKENFLQYFETSNHENNFTF